MLWTDTQTGQKKNEEYNWWQVGMCSKFASGTVGLPSRRRTEFSTGHRQRPRHLE